MLEHPFGQVHFIKKDEGHVTDRTKIVDYYPQQIDNPDFEITPVRADLEKKQLRRRGDQNSGHYENSFIIF